ncbi:hypothetical protein ASG81_21790 [Paenibacillus sp. Soil522]|nr:hypothetical protein ASG81_21790 [Paenibacillus sp. Soil522]
MVLGMILIFILFVYTIWISVIWLHEGIKFKQSAEMLKGILTLSVLTICLVIVCWYGSMIYDLVNMSEAIS